MKRIRTEQGKAIWNMERRLKRLYNSLPNEIRALDYRDEKPSRKPRAFKEGYRRPHRRDVFRMMDAQDGYCAICYQLLPEDRKFVHVDHCHDTLLVRGVLCHACNLGLGQFEDDPIVLRNAADYIEKFRIIHAKIKSDAQRALWRAFPDFFEALPLPD